MKTSKKMLSLLLIAAMLVSVLCMGVSASDTTFEPVSISEGEPVKIVWSGTTGTVVNVDGGTVPSDITVTATAATSTTKVFINGSNSNTFTTQGTARGIQILAQDGNKAPFILVIR